MGAFDYTAVDPAGRETRGVIEGDTPRQVRQLLRERRLLPLSVTEVAEQESSRQQSFTPAPFHVSRRTWRWSRASSPRWCTPPCRWRKPLLAVAEQTESPRIKSILLGVRSKVMEGHTLADGLA